MYPNEADRYATRIQKFAISDGTRLRNDNQQSTRTIVGSVCNKFRESMLLTWAVLCGLLMRVGKPSDLFVYALDGETKNIVCPIALL